MRSRWTLTALCLATFMLLLDITIVQVALPAIGREFHSDLTGLQWIVDAYVLPLAALIITLGTLADRFGRRRVFVSGVVVFTIGSLACGLATSTTALDIARVVQGLGGSAMFATTLALIGQEFAGAARGRAIVIWGSTVGAAVATGPLLGGLLTDVVGWRWIFLVNVPIGIATVVLTMRYVGAGRSDRPRRLDVLGAVTLTAGLALVTSGLLRGAVANWSGSGPVILLAGGAAALGVWAALQRRPLAMVDHTLYRSRGFLGVTVGTLGVGAGMFAMLLYLTVYLQNVLGASPLQGGLRLLPFASLVFVVPLLARRMSIPMVSGRTLGASLGLVSVGLVLMVSAGATTSWLRLLPGLVVAGFGVGLANPSIAASALAFVDPTRVGLASGVSNACRIAGITLGVAGLGAVQRHAIASSTPSGIAHSRVVDLIASGQLHVAAKLAPGAHTVAAAYTHGLHVTLLTGAGLVGLGALAAAVLMPHAAPSTAAPTPVQRVPAADHGSFEPDRLADANHV